MLSRALEMAAAVVVAHRVTLMRTKAKALRQSGLVEGTTLDL